MLRNPMSVVACVWLMVVGPAVAQDSPADRSVESIAHEYIQLTFQDRDLVAASELLAEDVRFSDPTGAVFGGPLAEGITGRQAVLDLQQRWAIEESAFNVESSFTSGDYACFAGTLDYQTKGQPAVKGIPFATILTFEGHAIVERLDLGDYTMVAAGGVVPERHLKRTGQAYLDAYLGMKMDEMAAMLADDAVYADPTAVPLGGEGPYEGRDAIIEAFRGAFGVVMSLTFDPVRTIAFQHHVVFAGTCGYSLKGSALGVDQETVQFTDVPLFVVLRIEGGKVVVHTDYSDYDVMNEQMEKVMNAGS